MSLDRKRQGELAELAFLHKAASLGLVVSKPYGDSARYDFIVDAGGALTRVQVKSVGVADRGSYHICSGSGHRSKTAYTAAQVDFLAAYVIPHDAWYIIPVTAFSPVKTLHVCPNRPSRRRFERYREAWRLLIEARPFGTKPRSFATVSRAEERAREPSVAQDDIVRQIRETNRTSQAASS